MVRNIIIAVLAVVVLGGAGVLAVQHHEQVQKERTAAAQSAAKEAQARAEATKQKQAEFLQEFQRVQGECVRAQGLLAKAKVNLDCSVSKPIDL